MKQAARRIVLTAGTVATATLTVSYQRREEPAITHKKAFDELPRSYDHQQFSEFWSQRPWQVALRACDVVSELFPIAWQMTRDIRNGDFDEKSQAGHAKRLKHSLIKLGPAFIKAGQQLSIRPDIVPQTMIKELSQLCDQVPPFEDGTAFQVFESELKASIDEVFVKKEFVCAASLGQTVAVKIQRPDMAAKVSLDLFVLRKLSSSYDKFCATFTKQKSYHVDLVDAFAEGSWSELDYEKEAENQCFFKKLLGEKGVDVYVPRVYNDLTSRKVLVSEWIEGTKLSDAPRTTISRLIPVGVELFLTQLLDLGRFHSDPHPGNLLVNSKGQLCLIDFGLCATVSAPARTAMTKAIVHLLTGDFSSLIAEDAKELGFLPHSLDTEQLEPVLTRILERGLLEAGSDLKRRRTHLMDISNDLNDVFFNYPFMVPPYFALVTRALGLLEGIALTGDPDFDIFQASYPYAIRCAVKTFGIQGMREILAAGRSRAGAVSSTLPLPLL